ARPAIGARQRQNQRRDEDIAHAVAQEPYAPQLAEFIPWLNTGRAKADDTDRRADGRANDGAEENQSKDIAESFERWSKSDDPIEQPCADESFERVACGDAQ